MINFLGIVSIIGAVFAMSAYIYASRKCKVTKEYHLTNLIACLILGYVAVVTRNPGYILLNGFWGIYAINELRKKEVLIDPAR